MIRSRRGPAIGFVGAICLSISGCQAPSHPVRICLQVLEPGEDPSRNPLHGSGGERIGAGRGAELAVAAGETRGFGFTVHCGEQSVAAIELTCEPLISSDSTLDSHAVRFFRLHSVAVEHFPGWYIRSVAPSDRVLRRFDVVVPLEAPQGGMPAKLMPWESYPFWADIEFPADARPGEYRSRVVLWRGTREIASMPLRVTLWPQAPIGASDVAVFAELSAQSVVRHRRVEPAALPLTSPPNSQSGGELSQPADLLDAVRLLRRHGVSAWVSDWAPTVRIGPAQELLTEWGSYDQTAAVREEIRNNESDFAACRYWPIPMEPIFSLLRDPQRARTPASRGLVCGYLRSCVRHFQESGLLNSSRGERPLVIPPKGLSAESLVDLGGMVREADPQVALVSFRFPQDMTPFGWLGHTPDPRTGLVDIWAPPAQFFDAATMAAERKRGAQTWLRVDRPPYSGSVAVYASATDVRVLTWQARALGAQAAFLGLVNDWPDTDGPATPEECIRWSAHSLVFPGATFGLSEPVASVRLKYLRDSVQDAAWCHRISQRGFSHVRDTMEQTLAPYAGTDAYRTHIHDARPKGWSDDWNQFEAAREILYDLLQTVRSATASKSELEALERGIGWSRFVERSGPIQAAVDGTRIRLSNNEAAPQASLETWLWIRNPSRSPWEGTVSMDPPESWAIADAAAASVRVEPHSFRRLRLLARVSAIPTEARGWSTLPIRLTDPNGESQSCNARAALLTAEPARAPIRIDGDLSDWPVGSINVAGDFALITGDTSDTAGGPLHRPRSRTTAFVLRDIDNLYVAVNCAAGRTEERAAPRRKDIIYDDLIPVGEEMIELLFDPLNAASRSPCDLFHLAVKRSGVEVAEKGLQVQPPLCPRTPWAAGAEIATSDAGDRWFVEVRIPLVDFQADSTMAAIWGFNVTRYDALHDEFSTWSGAVGNAFDPLSLGNLFIAGEEGR